VALRRGGCGQVRPGAGALSGGRARLGRGHAGRRLEDPAEEPRRAGKRDLARAAARPARSAGHARCASQGDRAAGAATAALAGAVQAVAGHQRRHPGPVRGQPAARGPAGEVRPCQRKLHRPGAVPERHSGRHRRAEVGFHPKRGRRHRPVSLRPAAALEGPTARAAAVLPERRAGALRGQQQRSGHGHQARGPGHQVPAVQPGQRRRRGQSLESGRRPPHGLPLAEGLGARELAGDSRSLRDHGAGQEDANREADLPPLPPA
jgi:hypothetical protein